jgi:hypothetical protein
MTTGFVPPPSLIEMANDVPRGAVGKVEIAGPDTLNVWCGKRPAIEPEGRHPRSEEGVAFTVKIGVLAGRDRHDVDVIPSSLSL